MFWTTAFALIGFRNVATDPPGFPYCNRSAVLYVLLINASKRVDATLPCLSFRKNKNVVAKKWQKRAARAQAIGTITTRDAEARRREERWWRGGLIAALVFLGLRRFTMELPTAGSPERSTNSPQP